MDCCMFTAYSESIQTPFTFLIPLLQPFWQSFENVFKTNKQDEILHKYIGMRPYDKKKKSFLYYLYFFYDRTCVSVSNLEFNYIWMSRKVKYLKWKRKNMLWWILYVIQSWTIKSVVAKNCANIKKKNAIMNKTRKKKRKCKAMAPVISQKHILWHKL